MRKIRIAVALVAIAALAISLTNSFTNSAKAQDRYILVSASGTVKVIPDAVRINATIAVVASANAAALSAVGAGASKLRAVLAANSIASKYVKSTNVAVLPEYSYTQNKGSTLVDYRASQTFEIIVRDAKSAGAIVDAMVSKVGNSLTIDGVAPFVYDNTSVTQKARDAAVVQARAKANSYAKLLAVKLGKIVYLEEQSNSAPFPVAMAMAKSDAGATVVDLGQQDVTVSINTRWSLN